ncbi:MAG: hypothetical protein M3R06_07800 [Chloroflexota bacterium]|nr:hypothetical protein [Chloroflexota bacterium]
MFRFWRTGRLALFASALLALVAAVPPALTGAQEATPAAEAAHQHETEPLSAESVAFIAEVQAASARFADFAVAEAEGYQRTTRYRLALDDEGEIKRARLGEFGPAHFVSRDAAGDDVILDPAKPEGLVYMRLPDGEMRLLGVMFAAPASDVPDIASSPVSWHTHNPGCARENGRRARSMTLAVDCPPDAQAPHVRYLSHVWFVGEPEEALAPHISRDYLRELLEETAAA